MVRRLDRAAAVIAWLACVMLAAQDDVPTFRTSVSLVRVDAEVRDSSGRDIPGLEARDFAVYDQDERREVLNFARESEGTPLDLLLVVDVSGSMRPHLQKLADSAAQTLAQLRPGDRAGLLLFASRPEVVQPLTSEFRQIEQALVGSMFKQILGRGTLLNEAIAAGARYLAEASPAKSRRALVVITDDLAAPGRVADAEVARAVSGAGAVLNAILAGDAGSAQRSRYADPSAPRLRSVARFAEQSGGRVVTAANVQEALSGVVGELRTRYSFQFAGAAEGTFRKLRLELSPAARARHPGAVIRAREGYYVTGEAPGAEPQSGSLPARPR